MHILFVDESGTPPKLFDKAPRYFVVGGIIIPETVWHRMRDALLGLKLRKKIRGEFKWRYFSPRNDDARNPMRALAWEVRNEIRNLIFKIVRDEPGITSLAAICSAKAAYKMPSVAVPEDIYKLTYKTISERFQYYLQDLSHTTGRKEYGIVVSDHRGSHDDRSLRRHHQKLLHSGGAFVSKYGNLIEGLFLESSNLSVGIQFADMIAGAVWQKFEKDRDTWFKEIEPTLRRSKTGQIYGYGLIKVPKNGWE